MTPLATRADIRSEGIMQQLCIAKGTELEHMVQQCAAGEAYLLSIRDARTVITSYSIHYTKLYEAAAARSRRR